MPKRDRMHFFLVFVIEIRFVSVVCLFEMPLFIWTLLSARRHLCSVADVSHFVLVLLCVLNVFVVALSRFECMSSSSHLISQNVSSSFWLILNFLECMECSKISFDFSRFPLVSIWLLLSSWISCFGVAGQCHSWFDFSLIFHDHFESCKCDDRKNNDCNNDEDR